MCFLFTWDQCTTGILLLMYRGLFIEPIPKFDVKVTNEREKIPKFDNLSIEITVVLNGKKHSVFINPVCFRHI